MSSFVAHQTKIILQSTLGLREAANKRASTTIGPGFAVLNPPPPSGREQKFHALLLDFNSHINGPPSVPHLKECIQILSETATSSSLPSIDLNISQGEHALQTALIGRVIIGVYGQIMETLLTEARAADDEAEWWNTIERSNMELVWYMIQTLPIRLKNLVQTCREYQIPLTFSSQTVIRLFRRTLQPSLLITALYPHLQHESHIFERTPLELTRDECRTKRKELVKLRDDRAERLGHLASMRDDLEDALVGADQENPDSGLMQICQIMHSHLNGGMPGQISAIRDSFIGSLDVLLSTDLPAHTAIHTQTMSTLSRPSTLVRLWPRVFLVPPVTLFLFRSAYGSRHSIAASMVRTFQTIQGFITSWLVEPISGILETVRTGGDHASRVINKESLRADLESLERMALSLSADKLAYTPSQLEQLAVQIQQGDLTPVLKIYEDDIKSPITSAITGSLVRSLLIQVHKAKVDIDFALTGIDKLLKSQELTFGFVGLAPALAIVYVLGAWLRDLWKGGKGKDRYGGEKRRERVWLTMRRIERLLMRPVSGTIGLEEETRGLSSRSGMSSPTLLSSSPPHRNDLSHDPSHLPPLTPGLLPPLTQGLLLLSLAQLRTFAERHLPPNTRIAQGFLEDIEDLEDPTLSKKEKVRVIYRMWRSWGKILGWGSIGK